MTARPISPAGVVVRPERADDVAAVRHVQAAAFGHHDVVPDLVDQLRARTAPLPPTSLVAEVDGAVVGHVMLSASRLDAPSRIVDVLVLSPLGVHPDHQQHGIGTLLVAHALAAADAQSVPLLFLEGSPDYYGARGFERADAIGFRTPSLRIPPPAFQVARLSAYEPWMTGTLVYSDVFWALDCVGLRPEAEDVVAVGVREKTVLDCPEPRVLADFYAAVLGMRVNEDSDDWVVIGRAPGMRELAFQRAESWVAPDWPDPDRPQQLHLDVRVADVDAAERWVLALGARRRPGSPEAGYRVFVDPVGHPFCLVHG